MSSHVLKIAPDSFAARIRAFIRAFIRAYKETKVQVRRNVPSARIFRALAVD